MNDELLKRLKFLGLNILSKNWEDIHRDAAIKKPSYLSFLKEIIEKEYNLKLEKARLARIKRAKIPEMFVMDTFPFNKQTKLDRRVVYELYDSLNFLTDNQVLLFLGPTGCGKSGLGTSFLVHAINNGYRGRFYDFSNLIELLNQAKGDRTEEKLIHKITSYDIILVDELGYKSCDRNQASMFFDLMRRRHKKNTTIITTQLGFDEWGSFLHDAHLTAALLDRITVNCAVFNMKDCISIRPKKIIYATKNKSD